MSMTVTVVLTDDDATWETAADQEKAVLGLFRDGSEPKVVRTQHRGGGLGFVVSSGEPPRRVRKPKAVSRDGERPPGTAEGDTDA